MARIRSTSSSSDQQPRGKTSVIIRVDGSRAWVDPAPAKLLVPLLVSEHRDFAFVDGRVVSRPTQKHFCNEVNGQFWIPAGLVTRVASVLKQHGHPVEIIDRTPPRPRVVIDP